MSLKLKAVRHQDGSPYGVIFDCPGCGEPHDIPTTGDKAWAFNGSMEAPTLSPSILVRFVRWDEWDEKTDRPQSVRNIVCHSFVTDGRIRFLGDCTHALAGQTVDLPEVS